MKFDVMTGGLPLRSMAAFAQDAERAGFSGIVVTEGGRTAYLGCGAAALAADIDILTGVAVAFPRSPMVTAEIAWELAEATGGRFRLGLGTQVRAHITRRYGSDFEHPGPRLKEYVLAMQAIFRAFRGDEPLAVDGEFYHLDLLPAQWSPGPIGAPNPPIDVAAVNPWMLRMAGEVADGVHRDLQTRLVGRQHHRLEGCTVPDQLAGLAVGVRSQHAGRAPVDGAVDDELDARDANSAAALARGKRGGVQTILGRGSPRWH